MERFETIVIVFNYFCKKTQSWIFERVIIMCRVLNISEFWILVNFRKYDKVMNESGCNYGRVLNVPGLRVGQVSEYAWIWLNNALWQDSKYAWSTFHRVLNKLKIWHGCEYAMVTACWMRLNRSEYPLKMSQYAWICPDNVKYDLICRQIPE